MSVTIALIGFERRDALAERIRHELPLYWTCGSSPSFVGWSVTEAITKLPDSGVDLCLIYAPPSSLGSALYTLLDQIHERLLPALAIVEESEVARSCLAGDDIITAPADEPMDRFSARITTLIRRQRTIGKLSDELRVARRFQGGLRGEMSRIQDELQLAAMVQREFLPKRAPEVGKVRFGVLFRPSGYVSGDIYDIRRLDERTVGCFLADAVGHGVPAALMTMVICRSLVMKEIEGGSYRIVDPSEALTRLNEDLARHQAIGGRFATGVYATIDIETREVRLSGAGHPPPLRIRADGSYEPITTSGGLLGVFDDATFDQVSFTLEDNESLIMYSDGFETAFPNEGADESRRRLPTRRYLDQFVDACGQARTASESTRLLADALDRQIGSLHQIDDLTAISVMPAQPDEVAQAPDYAEVNAA
ncbi:MAG: PP2C family protein-serine/threonine phosphatase [Phycisphaerales bacterium]